MGQELWRKVWRQGFAPQLPTEALRMLRRALAEDDRRLLQLSTTDLPALRAYEDEPVSQACAVGFCGLIGGLKLNGEVNRFFVAACAECDRLLDEPAVSRHFLNWFDDTPRPAMRRELGAEIDAELARRQSPAVSA